MGSRPESARVVMRRDEGVCPGDTYRRIQTLRSSTYPPVSLYLDFCLLFIVRVRGFGNLPDSGLG